MLLYTFGVPEGVFLMSSPVLNHSINGAVAAAPVASILAHFPLMVSTTVGLAALWYYYLVITKELRARAAEKAQLKMSAARVVEKIHADAPPAPPVN